MKPMSFSAFVATLEGILAPDRSPAAGLPRINTTDRTDDQRRKLVVKPVRPLPRSPASRKSCPGR